MCSHTRPQVPELRSDIIKSIAKLLTADANRVIVPRAPSRAAGLASGERTGSNIVFFGLPGEDTVLRIAAEKLQMAKSNQLHLVATFTWYTAQHAMSSRHPFIELITHR
jgi:hypothetical protein